MRNFFTQDLSKYKTDLLLYALLCVLAVSLRLFFLYAIDSPFIFFKYLVFAHQIAQGQDIGERLLDVSPLYLAFMTFLVKSGQADAILIKFVQVLFGVGNCLLIFAIGKKLLNRPSAFLGALLYAGYGQMMVLELTFEPLVFEIWFNLLTLYWLVRMREKGSPLRNSGYASCAGLCAGLAILAKPNLILVLPVAVIWLLFLMDVVLTPPRPSPKGRESPLSFGEGPGVRSFSGELNSPAPSMRAVRGWAAVLFCALAVVVVAPVTLRNYVKFHDFVLVTADYGKVFFHGNARTATNFGVAYLPNQDVDPTGRDEPDYAHVTFRKVAAQVTGKPLLPSAAARFWFNVTLRDIAAQPARFGFLELQKLQLFFHDYERCLFSSEFWSYKNSLAYPFVRYGLISALALLGMFLARKQWRTLFLLYGGIAIYVFSNLLFYVAARYRAPAAPYLCLFAGYALWVMVIWTREKRWRMVGFSLCVLIGLLAANYLPYEPEIRKAEQSMQQMFINSLRRHSFE